MVKSFYNLSIEAQIIIRERFGRYNIDGQYAFDHGDIFSDEVKSMSSNDIITFLGHKDISHIYPKSQYPFYNQVIDYFFSNDTLNFRAIIIDKSQLKETGQTKINRYEKRMNPICYM